MLLMFDTPNTKALRFCEAANPDRRFVFSSQKKDCAVLKGVISLFLL
jgi:hypothetical protein